MKIKKEKKKQNCCWKRLSSKKSGPFLTKSELDLGNGDAPWKETSPDQVLTVKGGATHSLNGITLLSWEWALN